MQTSSQFSEYMLYLEKHPATFMLVILWIALWKGIALWRSARNNQIGWFTGLLILQFFGLPEIIYVFFFSKTTEDKELAL